MNAIDKETTRAVAHYLETRKGVNEGCLTITFGCEGGGKNYQHHSKRLMNLLREQNAEWERSGKFPTVRKGLFSNAEILAEDGDRWSGDYEGVCLHLSETEASLIKLPTAPQENCWSGRRFRLRPAAETLASEREMLVLSLSFKEPRLFRFDGQTATAYSTIDLPDSVYSFSEDEVVDKGQRAHVRKSGGESAPSMARQGVSHEQSPRDLNEPVFLREIQHAIIALEESRSLPLVVVGDEAIVPEFRKSYNHAQGEMHSVTDEQSHPDEADVARICRRICREKYQKYVSEVLAKLNEQDPEGELYSTNIKDIVLAAENGRIAVCVLARDAEIWLKRDENQAIKSAEPDEEPEAFEALDKVFSEGSAKGASVVVVDDSEVPGGKTLAALFSW